jgi:type IV secretory pathway TraG/TraD family ATPase VirD4
LTDIADANESSYVIMMNLNKTWIQKQGDFFVGSAITLFTAIIWFLRCYQEGKYCTFPHAVELVNQPYEKWFPILMSYPDLDAFMTNFVNSFENGAMEQLQGQVASVQIAVSMLVSPRVYWTMSGNDFSFDINNPDEPKILCVGNNPERESVYAAALGLVNARIVQLTNKQDKMPCGIIVDELPTMYFRKIDNLINTARSNKVAICLGFQDNSQLKRDYGDKEYEVIVSTIGNLFAGQVLGNTAKSLQERYGKVLQERQSMSVNRNDTSTSYSTQMDYLIPAGKIANLRQGTFVGNVVEDLRMVDERGNAIEGMVQNIFHAKIIVDHNKVKADEKRYQKLPIITDFTRDGRDCMNEIIQGNFQKVKADVKQIIADELERIENDPDLRYLQHQD